MTRKLILASAGLLVLVLGAALLAPMLVDVDQYRAQIEAAISDAIRREVKLGELNFRILPTPAIAAESITISEDPRYGDESFLRSDSLRISIDLLPLLRGQVGVDSILITAPQLVIRRNSGGEWNLASLVQAPVDEQGRRAGDAGSVQGGPQSPDAASSTESGAAGTGSRVTLSIDELVLSDGEVTFLDGAMVPGQIVKSQARAIDLRLSDLSATSPVGINLSFELEGAGKVELEGHIGPLPAAGAPSNSVPLDARLVLDEFQAGPAAGYIRTFTGLQINKGLIDLDLSVKGDAPGSLAVEGSADLNGLNMNSLSGEGRPVDLSGSVRIKGILGDDETRIESAVIRTGKSEVKLSGTLKHLATEPVIDAHVSTEKVALDDIKAVLQLLGPVFPAGLGGAGEIQLDVSLTGELENPAKMNLEGTAVISGLEFSDPAIREPISAIRGNVRMSSGRLEIDDFAASLGKSSIAGSCSMTRFERPLFDVTLSSPLIDLDDLLSLMSSSNPATSGVISRPGSAHARGSVGKPDPVIFAVAGKPADGRWSLAAKASGRPGSVQASALQSITVHGSLAVDQVRIMNLVLTTARATFGLDQGVARLDDVTLDLYGGSFAGNLSAELDSPGPPFRMVSMLTDVDFNRLASDLSPELKDLIFGTLNAGLDLSGRGLGSKELDRNLRGSGHMALREGKLTSFGALKQLAEGLEAAGGPLIGKEETPFKILTATFDIAKGRGRTKDLRLKSPDLTLKGDGEVKLDLTMDLDLAARISKPVSRQMVSRTPNLRYLLNKKKKLALDIRLVGDLADPSVRIHGDTFKRIARAAAKEQVRDKGKSILKKLLDSGGDD
jgi:uncharacterized protein involved in outer membrane biogenesis